MTATTTIPSGFTDEAFEAFLAARDEPAWVTEQRREAWQAFGRMEWPKSDQEEWRRTDIRMFRLEKYKPPQALSGEAGLPPALLAEGVQLAGRTAALNSQSVVSELDPALAAQGVLFGGAEQILREHGEKLRPYFGGPAFSMEHDRFSALHGAFWCGGAVLYVPRGVQIAEPLHVLSALTPEGADLGRITVVMEEGSEATLLTETAGGGNLSFHCGAIELLLAPGARLRFVSLQHWDNTVWHFAQQQARLQRNAQLQWTIGALGARLAKVNQEVVLCGDGANAQVNGVMFTEGKQHLAYHTLQHHEAGNCTSDLLYKGALQDQSRIVWRGMIKVDPGADGTDGYQRNDNLMLSNHARSDSIPGLEIEADDVRCTHGSTTSRVDEELIFYAQSRGLTRREATRMIVSGFFQQVFDRITIDSVREALGEAIGRRIREYRET
jgi:Fe-S cluster assembly protein SufD